MRLSGYYTSGQFAKMAHVSVRTIRFYDKQNILKPSLVNESGARFYTDADFARLQQILLFKYLGFSLEEIKELTIQELDSGFIQNSLNMQLKLVKDRIEQMQLVEQAIENTARAIETGSTPDWSQMLDLIHLTSMENSLKSQYQDAGNISSRIRLHSLYSTNKEGWFPWLFRQCMDTLMPKDTDSLSGTPQACSTTPPAMPQNYSGSPLHILETGCGNGSLWTENIDRLPPNIHITLSDISEGMIRDARRALGTEDLRFEFEQMDCQNIPYPDNTFDAVLANHVLFYCEDIEQAIREACRCLKPGGIFLCSTYGPAHMQEISRLVEQFDSRIVLSAEKLYERFGSKNGAAALSIYFPSVRYEAYEDALNVTKAEHLIEYILSCHGNQNQYLLDRYKDFRSFVERRTKKGFSITKDAGIFICKKNAKNA